VLAKDVDAGHPIDAGNATDTDSAIDAGDTSDAMPRLSGQSRFYDHVLNIVDSNAAAELDKALTTTPPTSAVLERCARAFYLLYPDEYDFLFFFSTNILTANVGPYRFPVNSDPIPGIGITEPITRAQYFSRGRLTAIIPVPSYENQGDIPGHGPRTPPLLRLIGNSWANYLSPRLGFGRDAGRDVHPGWGDTSVYGQLGGFDAKSLRCQTPAGAVPPDCQPESNGKYRYLVSDFALGGNGYLNIPYAPLELYLMGLVTRAEVPESFIVMLDGALDATTKSDTDGIVAVDATGLGTIELADIVSLHGERPLLEPAQRHFNSAFVVFSASPAPDHYMQLVSGYAETLGNHRPDDTADISFEVATGGRATLETTLGSRRSASDPLVVLKSQACDPIAQDCADGAGCYNPYEPNCRPQGQAKSGDSCLVDTDCVAGDICMGHAPGLCAPFCDGSDASSPKACARLCPTNFVTPTTPLPGKHTVSLCGAGTLDP
jgi:hypothetical protein